MSWCSSMPDSSLTAMSRARAGQPAMIRLIVPGWAVATLVARLAAVPMSNAAQGMGRRGSSGGLGGA